MNYWLHKVDIPIPIYRNNSKEDEGGIADLADDDCGVSSRGRTNHAMAPKGDRSWQALDDFP